MKSIYDTLKSFPKLFEYDENIAINNEIANKLNNKVDKPNVKLDKPVNKVDKTNVKLDKTERNTESCLQYELDNNPFFFS